MLSLYIHIPFCVGKCLYCGFYSTPYSPELSNEYLSGLLLEAKDYKDAFRERAFDTVYIGGGTPTTLSSRQFVQLCGIIPGHFKISEHAEFTVEANPDTITKEKLDLMLERRVNRLSIGIQSFSDELLKTLGRPHTAVQAMDAVHLARAAGFENIGMDLIYGIPGQDIGRWRESLNRVIEQRPEHVSTYSLSLDENAWFTRETEAGRLSLPGEGAVARMYELAVTMLTDAGYRHYEISNFSLPGFECRHNMNYWDRGEYLGLGPAAWSFGQGKRHSNIPDVRDYCRRLRAGLSPIEFREPVGPEEAAAEALLLGMRTERGVDLDRFGREHGMPARERLARNMETLRDSGLVSVVSGRLRLTERALLLSDEVTLRLWQ